MHETRDHFDANPPAPTATLDVALAVDVALEAPAEPAPGGEVVEAAAAAAWGTDDEVAGAAEVAWCISDDEAAEASEVAKYELRSISAQLAVLRRAIADLSGLVHALADTVKDGHGRVAQLHEPAYAKGFTLTLVDATAKKQSRAESTSAPRKRGRPSKRTAATVVAAPSDVPRRRGRPPGSRNRTAPKPRTQPKTRARAATSTRGKRR